MSIATSADLMAWLGDLSRDFRADVPAYGDLAVLLLKTCAHLDAFESNWALPCTGSFKRRVRMLAYLRELRTLLETSSGQPRAAASRLWGLIAVDYDEWNLHGEASRE